MGERVIALVPVKLNSSRVPGKNRKLLAGKPLLWHICSTLSSITEIDKVCVYCSSPEVESLLPEGVTWVQRPPWLDSDKVKGAQIYREFISKFDASIYVLAHTTSPFIEAGTIRKGLHAILKDNYDSAFTARSYQTFAWFNGRPLNYDPEDVPRTQDISPVLIETSGFYMFRKEVFLNGERRIGERPFVVEVDEVEAIDIDEPEDFEFAKLISTAMQQSV